MCRYHKKFFLSYEIFLPFYTAKFLPFANGKNFYHMQIILASLCLKTVFKPYRNNKKFYILQMEKIATSNGKNLSYDRKFFSCFVTFCFKTTFLKYWFQLSLSFFQLPFIGNKLRATNY